METTELAMWSGGSTAPPSRVTRMKKRIQSGSWKRNRPVTSSYSRHPRLQTSLAAPACANGVQVKLRLEPAAAKLADMLPVYAAHQHSKMRMQHLHTCALPLAAVVAVTCGLPRIGHQQHLGALDALRAAVACGDSAARAQVAKGAGLSKVCQHHLRKALGCEPLLLVTSSATDCSCSN